MKLVRAAVRTQPAAKIALERAEHRLRFVLRVIELWDAGHAKRAEQLVRLGSHSAANTFASLIFDDETRHALLERCFVGGDAGALDRMSANVELSREVLS
jgi:hypothetical protein